MINRGHNVSNSMMNKKTGLFGLSTALWLALAVGTILQKNVAMAMNHRSDNSSFWPGEDLREMEVLDEHKEVFLYYEKQQELKNKGKITEIKSYLTKVVNNDAPHDEKSWKDKCRDFYETLAIDFSYNNEFSKYKRYVYEAAIKWLTNNHYEDDELVSDSVDLLHSQVDELNSEAFLGGDGGALDALRDISGAFCGCFAFIRWGAVCANLPDGEKNESSMEEIGFSKAQEETFTALSAIMEVGYRTLELRNGKCNMENLEIKIDWARERVDSAIESINNVAIGPDLLQDSNASNMPCFLKSSARMLDEIFWKVAAMATIWRVKQSF